MVLNNGWTSDPINLERGVRQGCPLSPLLFIIVAETLGNAIRKDSHIQGMEIPGTTKQSKISQYADDATLTLADDQSVIRSVDIINKFEAATGGKLNMEKKKEIYIDRKYIYRCTRSKIGNYQHQQWKEKVEKAEEKLEQWTNRRRSIEGRAVLIRTYSLATIIYLATVFPLPDPISTRINKAIFAFLWKSGTEVVALETCHLPKGQGGLNIRNIPRRYRTVREHSEHSENIPNIPRTYWTFREHTEHSENILDI